MNRVPHPIPQENPVIAPYFCIIYVKLHKGTTTLAEQQLAAVDEPVFTDLPTWSVYPPTANGLR